MITFEAQGERRLMGASFPIDRKVVASRIIPDEWIDPFFDSKIAFIETEGLIKSPLSVHRDMLNYFTSISSDNLDLEVLESRRELGVDEFLRGETGDEANIVSNPSGFIRPNILKSFENFCILTDRESILSYLPGEAKRSKVEREYIDSVRAFTILSYHSLLSLEDSDPERRNAYVQRNIMDLFVFNPISGINFYGFDIDTIPDSQTPSLWLAHIALSIEKSGQVTTHGVDRAKELLAPYPGMTLEKLKSISANEKLRLGESMTVRSRILEQQVAYLLRLKQENGSTIDSLRERIGAIEKDLKTAEEEARGANSAAAQLRLEIDRLKRLDPSISKKEGELRRLDAEIAIRQGKIDAYFEVISAGRNPDEVIRILRESGISVNVNMSEKTERDAGVSDPDGHYRAIGIIPGFLDSLPTNEAVVEVLESHKKRLAMRLHPDKDPRNVERMKDINTAIDFLKDPKNRAGYGRRDR